MRCPTCAKPVAKNQNVCSFCGSLVTDIGVSQTAAAPDGKTAQEPVFSDWEMHPRPPVFEAPDTKGPQTSEPRPVEEPSLPEPSEPALPAPRRPVPLIRVLTLLVFLLVPVFNSLLRNFVFERTSSAAPVLREAVLCEQYAAGSPVNPKAVFSLQRDGQVVLYTEWRGSRQGHAVMMYWYTPQGMRLGAPLRYEAGRRAFAASSILALRPGMPTGNWKAEVLLDGQMRGDLRFQVQE